MELKAQMGCPVELTFSIISGKWKGIIIFHLLVSGTIRFNELQRRLVDTTPRMLTKQLRELEQDGIVHREVYAEIPPKVEYSLTELGRSLSPILNQIESWGIQYANQLKLDDSEITGSNNRTKQIIEALHHPPAGCDNTK